MATAKRDTYIPRALSAEQDVTANLISFSRLLCVPALVVAARLGAMRFWLVLMCYALLSDMIDGRVARTLGTASDSGARIDSIADCALYLTAPACVIMLFPWLRAAELVPVLLVTLAYAVPIAYGFAKYQRLTSYHTTAARITAVSLSVSFFLLLTTHVAWPFHIAVAALLLAALEEISITRTLPHWEANVASIREARRRAGLSRLTGDGYSRAAGST